jgi:hypothetical protein
MKTFNLILFFCFTYMFLSEWNNLDMRFLKKEEVTYQITKVSKNDEALTILTVKNLKTNKEYDLTADIKYGDFKKLNLNGKNVKIVKSVYGNKYGKQQLNFEEVIIKNKSIPLL